MIGMLLDGNYDKDIRVRKEAESMVAAGLDVLVICTWIEGQAREEEIKGVKVIRIGKHSSAKRIGIRYTTLSWFFIYWLFYKKVPKILQAHQVTHLHVHDLIMVKTGIKLKKYISGKLIFDSHENYPELLEVWFMTKKSLFVRIKNHLFFKPNRWKRHEQKVLGKVDKVITVVEEMTEKYLRENTQLQEDHFLKVSNYERLAFANKASVVASDADFTFKDDTFYILYVGGIGPIRGIDTVINAVHELKNRNFQVEFVVLGAGHANYIKELKDLVVALNIEDRIHFLGYKPFDTVNYYMQSAGINIIPHKKTNHTDHTIPHKLFQIFLSKAPILVSSCKPLKRHVETTDGGWVFEADDKMSLSDQIIAIKETSEVDRQHKIDNAYNAAVQTYNWEAEAERLILFYKNI